MHQAGWTRLRLRPAAKPGPFVARVHSPPSHPVRPNFSLRRIVPRSVLQNRGLRSPKLPSQEAASALPSLKKLSVPLAIDRSTSRKSLYENLLRLLASPATASLPILLDYHALHPAALRSVRSYNLLISLAIRHVAWGVVQSLVENMSVDGIDGNLETQTLKTRWFPRHRTRKPIPLSLWLEFFHGVKAGALANRLSSAVNSPLTRFQILMQNLPVFLPNEDRKSVRTVHTIVRAMLALDRPQSALALATRYFHGLPRQISIKWAQKCVAIMDGLVAHEANRTGLLDFYTARRKLNSLLGIHPAFRPTAKTVYLLLGTLRQAKQRGTLSWRTLTKYKARWGAQVEDRRVRRRLASYAITERRLDIFNKETEERSSQLRRRPFREIYSRQGHDDRLWRLLEVRATKVRWLLEGKGV
ncbi:hypothetical protein FB45DRAFT_916762 [Roridomyces roridus]|uniref:Uncharacterized protein n=1 Tax=Roridomyces roridus TaxID=1738132 RepID=A0AAD7BVB8_9AGAR|nr:hypothetical protein FB45DRAFT_916762 [Roridomyces roridus]